MMVRAIKDLRRDLRKTYQSEMSDELRAGWKTFIERNFGEGYI